MQVSVTTVHLKSPADDLVHCSNKQTNTPESKTTDIEVAGESLSRSPTLLVAFCSVNLGTWESPAINLTKQLNK
jgi:hypothetical protein